MIARWRTRLYFLQLASFSWASSSAAFHLRTALSSSTGVGNLPEASGKSFFIRSASCARSSPSWRLRIWNCQNVTWSRSSHPTIRCISDSAEASATFASSPNLISATRKTLRVSIESTRAVSDMAKPPRLPLLQVVLDQRGFLPEERHVLVGGLHEAAHRLQRLLE